MWMNQNKSARARAVATATLAGLALFFICLRTVSAQAPQSGPTDTAAAQVWHVDNSPGEGLVGYWKFDQVFDGVTFNSVLLSNKSQLSAGSAITSAVATSVTVADTGALQLDGVNGMAVVSDAVQLDVPTNSFSVAAWARRGTTGTYDAIFDSGSETNKWWIFIADNSGTKANRFGFGVRGISETYSTRSITDTNWHHLAVVMSGSVSSNLTFYVDGVASGVVTATNVLTPSGDKHIGALLDGSLLAFFGGSLDELRLYNRPLSAAEVGRLAAGRGCVTDGASWPTAFEDLQCALNVAQDGDQIWIAAGTYRPGTDKFVSYRLVNGVSLFGGFNGAESSPAQRPPFDPKAPLTTLSGDAVADDVPASFGNYVENTCNVMVAGSLAFPGSVSATVDGLAVQEGNADAGAACGFPSASDGGGLLAIGPSQLTLSNILFKSNRASGSGGGLAAGGGNVTVTVSSFVSNTAGSTGGAVSVIGTLTMSGSSVSLNRAVDPVPASDFTPVGGGVFVSGTAFITDTQFFTNTGILTGGVFLNNLAGGGGLAVTGTLALTGGDFEGNSAEHGGGLQVLGSATIQGSLFQSNNAGSGGGVFADGDLTLVTNRLIDNTALETLTSQPSEGGGLFLQNGGLSGKVSNNLFLGNRVITADATTPAGAAMSLDGIITLVNNNTIVDGGLITVSAASVTGTTGLFNNIITSATIGIEALGGVTFDDYNLFSGDTITATGVISALGHSRTADPRFVAPGLNDYRLRLDSPAVDAGDNSRVPLFVTTDLSGGKRFVDVPSVPDTGAGSAPIVDIGAFEVNNLLFLPLIRK
jgi:predicted outer membrane repeat protein